MVRNLETQIPDYKEFFTVDELDASSKALASKYPDKVSMEQIGESKKGHPIWCLKIGTGEKNILAFACPHPNEPIGAMTLECLSWKLAEEDSFYLLDRYTWYIIKCVDPDATKLNEGWFKGPFTLLNYASNYYRPAMNEQVEWTFPIDYKNLHFHEPVCETRALMKLMERIKPVFLYSLHNAGFGGAFWYISKNIHEVTANLGEIASAHHVPLALGEPEMPFCEAYAPAVYQLVGVEDMYDYYETYVSKEPESMITHGASSNSYANRVSDTVSLVCELPYFYNDAVDNQSDSDIMRRDALVQSCDIIEDTCSYLKEHIAKVADAIVDPNPFKSMVQDFVRMMSDDCKAKRQWAMDTIPADVPAKVCEAFDSIYGMKFFCMLNVGLYEHMLRDELSMNKQKLADNGQLELFQTEFDNAKNKLEQMNQDFTDHVSYEVIPIKKLIAIQLESAFLVLDKLEDK